MPSTIASGSSWSFSSRSSAALAVAALLASSSPAAAGGSDDCNVNGIPDAAEIAAGLVDDCNANGVPDPCEYATVAFEAETNPFGSGSPLVVPIDQAPHAISDMRITLSVRADLDSVTEAVQAKVGNTVVATLWITGGQSCPAEPQLQTVIVPMATVNASIDANGGDLIVALETIGPVGVKECPSSFAAMAVEYIGDLLPPDCLGNGTWDGCDIAADPSLDCDVDGLIDLCEIEDDPSLDCDGNGQIDACEIASDPGLDCNGNGILDSCDIAANPAFDCDGNGQIDACELAADPALDCNGNGILDSCDLAANPAFDCDGNGQIDSCEIAADPGLDCNDNNALDACELISAAAGLSCDPDCDGDGTHDACQINADPALDKNGDGILDACQYARGDLTLDRTVDGADLAFMLGLWGTPNPPIGDLTGDGTIDGADLAELLGRWDENLLLTDCWGTVLAVAPDPQVITEPEWRERIIATGLPWRVQDNASGIEMLLIPPGTFMMGCSPSQSYGCISDENPVHEVTLTQAFYLGRYEVTQAQWTAVMGSNPSYFQGASAEVPAAQIPLRPVERVSWNMIQGFEAATGLRLPTEAEWEYACRAGTQTAFNLPPEGTNADSQLGLLGWYSSNAASQTRPVGQKQANNLGLHDMHGNVREWCEDWYGGGYYAESPPNDPPGPISGEVRVLRGGGWSSNSQFCRAANRGGGDPGSVVFDDGGLGFRAARTP